MREIVLDTETTGLDPAEGHRIVEIGAVELISLVPTGKTFHVYINPERDMPEEAFAVHGLGNAFLADKPVFKTIAQDFLNFILDAKLVIHNAAFDMKFLNAELKWAGFPELPAAQAVDTLMIARKKYAGAQNSLDALCRRFGVDNSSREKHGALLDSELLAAVYLELMGGKQPDFGLRVVADASKSSSEEMTDWTPPQRPSSLEERLSETEKKAHRAFLETLSASNLWRNDV